MATGWIALHRAITEHWVWRGEPYTKGQAWVDLILTANHEEKSVPFDGRFVTVERGCILTSETKLADRWKWSRKKVHRFLEMLEDDKMLSRVCPESVPNMDKKGAYLSLCNYSDWQESGTGKAPAKHRQGTGEAHKQQCKQINNITSKDIKDMAGRFTPPTIDEVTLYCQERKNTISAQRFVDFYTSKNWMVGKNKMRDWKAAVRGWENRSKDEAPKGHASQPKPNKFHNFEGQLEKLSEDELNALINKRKGKGGLGP